MYQKNQLKFKSFKPNFLMMLKVPFIYNLALQYVVGIKNLFSPTGGLSVCYFYITGGLTLNNLDPIIRNTL